MPGSTMASTDILQPPQEGQREIRSRLRGACEECRNKKTRCDSAKRHGKRCSKCEASNVPCVPTIPKKAQMQQTYIRILESRIKRLEGYIQALYPGMDVDLILSKPPQAASQPPVLNIRSASSSWGPPTYPTAQSIHSDTTSVTPEDDSNVSDSEDLAHVSLAEHMGRLSLTPIPKVRFFGQASPFMVGTRVSAMRSKITGELDTGLDPKTNKRSIYWGLNPWELAFITTPEVSYVFPEDDLLINLVVLYFEKTNSLIPVLHKPTFMRSLTLGQHHWDPCFGMTVLLVCAIGSRYSMDPRVLSVPDAAVPGLSSGWHYYCQVPVHRKLMLFKSSVYDLQYYCLAALYLVGTSLGHTIPTMLAIGLRYGLEIGAHRRRNPDSKPSIDYELQKRAFWALFCLDQIANSFLGRPCTVSHESLDVEYPIECDDEYWEPDDPEEAFQQPAGKPCSITSFVHFIKLCEILGFALRTLYTTKKTKVLSGQNGNEWEMRMVAELDSSMNKWKDSLPPYLQWDPQRQDDLFLQQAANLHATFYYVQIQIHRPFLTRKSSLSFSSLAMCTNAARACAHIQEAAITRDLLVLPNTSTNAFTSGIIIVLCLWGSQNSGYIGDYAKETENLQKCINVLRAMEERWHSAGALGDMLREAGVMNRHPSERMEAQRTKPSFNIEDHVQSSNAQSATTNLSMERGLPSMNEWDLQELLSTEMESTEAWYPVQCSVPFYPNENQQDQTTSSASVNMPNALPGDSTFTFWADAPTAFNYFDEWDTYFANMGQT